jgi:hypothetical protein
MARAPCVAHNTVERPLKTIAVHDSGEWEGGPSSEAAVTTGPSPARPHGVDRAKGDFMTGFSLQTLGFPEIHGDVSPIKLNLRIALLIYLAEAQGAVARHRSVGRPASGLQ